MQQIHRHFPAPFGDERKKVTIIYPDEDDSSSALIRIDDKFQGTISFDRRSKQFRIGGLARKSKLTNENFDQIVNLFIKYKMHDGIRWLRIEQPEFEF